MFRLGVSNILQVSINWEVVQRPPKANTNSWRCSKCTTSDIRIRLKMDVVVVRNDQRYRLIDAIDIWFVLIDALVKLVNVIALFRNIAANLGQSAINYFKILSLNLISENNRGNVRSPLQNVDQMFGDLGGLGVLGQLLNVWLVTFDLIVTVVFIDCELRIMNLPVLSEPRQSWRKRWASFVGNTDWYRPSHGVPWLPKLG